MKQGSIVCPRGTEPQILKNAKECYAAYKNDLTKHRVKPRSKGKKAIEYKDLDEKSKKKIQESVLASEATAMLSVSTVSVSTTKSGPAIFMLHIPVFNITLPSCHTIPLPIQADFPHIRLQLGSALGSKNCPNIRYIVDTATALTTDNHHFSVSIAKTYPHTFASIRSPKDNLPITSSRLVQHGGSSITTNLTIGFEFHLLYLMHEGTPTCFSVAAGNDVSVNIILGLPFIRQTKNGN
jgi:hypothetical protein